MNTELIDEGDWKVAKPKPKINKQTNKNKSFNSPGAQDVLKHIPDEFNGEIVAKIRSLIESHPKVLIIMRGLPGAGKSTLARLLVTHLLSSTMVFF